MMLVSRRNYRDGARMAMLSSTELLDWLGEYQFLSQEQVDELRPTVSTFPDCRSFAKELILRDWLAPYQVNQILQGKSQELILGGYRLRERIGEGAMGQVFKAWSLRMARYVAVKTVTKDLVNSQKMMDRFRRELQTASKLIHPNIALVRDADEVEGRTFLVMDFIDGFNLSHRVKQDGPLPIHEAVDYARQAALGLEHAFQNGIVHRDIKPGNLMVTTATSNGVTSPLVKILDFGLARYESETDKAGRLTVVGKLLGTIDYIAPEQAQNASTADIRADIYGLGCTLFFILTGQPPFQGSSVVEKIGPRLIGEPPSVAAVRPEVPAALDEVVRKMMARLPGDRYQTPIEVAQALEPFTVKSAPVIPLAQAITETDSSEVPMAMPVAPNAVAAGPVLMATPILATTPIPKPPEAVIPQATFLAPLLDNDPEPQSAAVEDPSFLNMTASGRDMSTGATAAKPAVPKAPQGFPLKLVLIGTGGLLACTFLILGLWYASSFAPANTSSAPKGSLKITEAKFSMPSKEVRAGDTKFVLVYIKRVDFKGPVKVSLKDLPDGVMSEPKTMADKIDRCDIRFTVSRGTEPMKVPIRVVAECETEGISAEMPLELKVIPESK